MRLSYSLLEHFQSCQFRAKVWDFDRVKGEAAADPTSSLVGQLAHEGQRAFILAEDPEAAMWARLERTNLEQTEKLGLVARCLDMVDRWRHSVPSFSPELCNPVTMPFQGSTALPRTPEVMSDPATLMRALVDARLVVRLEPAIGIFDEFVFKPDLVCLYGGDQFLRLYDWKWTGDLDDTEDSPYRYDLQSAMYQWGLARLGLEVRCHAIVQGRIEPPTPFSLNKDGSVSRRKIRNTWEEYVRFCVEHGQEPREEMRENLLPFFRHHLNFRSTKEVDAIWATTVVPLALQISKAARYVGFARRQSHAFCGRCPVREECALGLTGHASHPAFNTRVPLPKEVRSDERASA